MFVALFSLLKHLIQNIFSVFYIVMFVCSTYCQSFIIFYFFIFLTAGNDEKKGQRSVMKIKEEILNAKGSLYGLFYYIMLHISHFLKKFFN